MQLLNSWYEWSEVLHELNASAYEVLHEVAQLVALLRAWWQVLLAEVKPRVSTLWLERYSSTRVWLTLGGCVVWCVIVHVVALAVVARRWCTQRQSA